MNKTNIMSTVGLILIGLGLFVLYPILRATTEFNLTMIVISIGILTFIAIFYSFVLKKEIDVRRKQMLSSKWKDNAHVFKNHVDKLIEVTEEDIPNYDELLTVTQRISSILESIAQLERETNLNRILRSSVMACLIAMLSLFVDMVNPFIYAGIAIFRVPGIIAFLYAFYYSLELTLLWFTITEIEISNDFQ